MGCAHRDPDFAPVEVWSGYVEAATFRSGSDRVQLELTETGPGSIAGRIILGEGPFRYARVEEWAEASAEFIEGFDYTLIGDSRREGDRILAVAAQREVWCEFCEAQVSFEHQREGVYTCDPGPPSGDFPDDAHLHACNEPWATFHGACSCDPEGCSAPGFGDGAEPERSIGLDVAADGDTAVGTLVASHSGAAASTVHLQRVQ